MTYTIADLFCGAGGSGLDASVVPGVQLRYAANHWRRAVETHAENFPDVDHDVADISQVDPRRTALTVWVPTLFDQPELAAAERAALRYRGWLPLRDGRVLCPRHVAGLEHLARAAVDGLPFDEGDAR
jgi:hypothetical protein